MLRSKVSPGITKQLYDTFVAAAVENYDYTHTEPVTKTLLSDFNWDGWRVIEVESFPGVKLSGVDPPG